jgi:hypothetical protein
MIPVLFRPDSLSGMAPLLRSELKWLRSGIETLPFMIDTMHKMKRCSHLHIVSATRTTTVQGSL